MAEDADQPAVEPRVDVAYALTTRVTELEAKLESERSSLWARLGATAGVLGLLLSIVNGAFTLVDQLFWKPDEEKVGEYNAFKGDVRSIISIDEDALKAANNPGAPDGVALAFANQKTQSILQDVNRLLRLLGSSATRKDGKYFIGSYDYSVLSQASYSGGNAESALRFAREAVKSADNTHTKSEALRSEAIMIMQARGNAGEAEAQDAIGEAEEALDQADGEMPSYAIAFDRAFLYVTRSTIEMNTGKCVKAVGDAGKALAIVSPKDNPMMAAASQMVAAQIAAATRGQSCPISAFPALIQSLAASTFAQPNAAALPSAAGAGGANPWPGAPLQSDAAKGDGLRGLR